MPIPAPAPVASTSNIRPVGSVLDGVTAELGGFTLGVVHSSGANVHLAQLDGWWDTPPSTGTVEQRSQQHGGWASPAFYASRVVTLEARVRAATYPQATAVVDELLAAVPLDELGEFLVTDAAGRMLSAAVRQEGDPIVARRGGAANVSLSLVAPDPRKYDPALQVASTGLPQTVGGLSLPMTLPASIGATTIAGVLSATNDGNLDTSPVFTVVGPCPPFTITHRATGRTLRYHEAVAEGRTVVVDVDARTAKLDGVAARYITGQWFDYTPGVNEVAFSASSYNPAALLVSSHRSAWR